MVERGDTVLDGFASNATVYNAEPCVNRQYPCLVTGSYIPYLHPGIGSLTVSEINDEPANTT